MPPHPSASLEEALHRFGLSSFRPGQAEVISQIVAGHDCLCVMPTGGGKSLCFQLPSLVRPGLTIVVSPLIALMKDQVDALLRRGIPATLVNSSLTGTEQSQRLQQIAEGKFSLVYVAPERLRNPRFLEAIRATPIQLLAIDEAHCISEWGHDFRPDYARIGQFREWLGGIQTVALTATATPRVRQDILQILKLKSPKQFVTGFTRKNLHFAVIPCHSDREKEEEIVQFLRTKPGFGIIYAATRKRCEELVASLGKSLKISLGAYHAGLTIEQRKFIQDRFMKGELQAIVATNAFGMGIDKSDLRYVIHYNMPGSLEAYYQEAGRAGRDGKPSQCVLLFSYQDRYVQEFFIDNKYPPAAMVKDIYDYLLEAPGDPIELTQQEIRENLDISLSAEAVGTSLQLLSRTGVLERLDAGAGLAMVRISSDLPTLVDLLPRTSERRRKVLRVLERAVGDRRYEAVYVHPRWLMDQTQLERDAIQETMRELCKLDQVEYVPPFRGRAVHFRRKDMSFEELQIDFKAQDELKKAEYEKLEQVIAFAESKRCRQLSVLQYFGDPFAEPCGLCDRCLNRVGWFAIENVGLDTSEKGERESRESIEPKPASIALPTTELPVEIVALIRRVLTAVSKTHGRLGKILIAQYLAGSENAKLQRLRLHQMPDFAYLRPLKQADVATLMDRLLSAGLIVQHEASRHRPTVSISEVGMKIAKGEQKIPQGFLIPAPLLKRLLALLAERNRAIEPARSASSALGTNVDATNSERTVQASEGTTRHDRIDAAASKISPILDSSGSKELESHHSQPPASLDGALEDWHWTWKLAEKGFALFECAAIRRKTIDSILRDLESGARIGHQVSLETLLERETLEAALSFLASKRNSSRDAGLPNLEIHPLLRRYPAMVALLEAMVAKTEDRPTSRPSTLAANPVF